MNTNNRPPASSAGMSKNPIFGTASVRLFAPQYVFELVRAEASAAARSSASDWRPPAANQNHELDRNTAA
jgi:hypothetical protein